MPIAEPIQTDNDLRRMIDDLRHENDALRHRINKLEQIIGIQRKRARGQNKSKYGGRAHGE